MAGRARAVLGATLVLATVVAIAIVLLRQSLLRGPVREAAEKRLSAALGQPVTIGDMGVSLFPRPALTGSDIRVGSVDVPAPSIRLARVRIAPRLRSLFGGALEIDDVLLEGFVVSILHGRDGRWRAPAVAPVPADGSSVSVARVRIAGGRLRVFDEGARGDLRERSSVDSIDAGVVPRDGGIQLSDVRGRIGDAQITGEARADRSTVRLEFAAPSITSDDLSPMLALLGGERPDFVRLDEPASLSATIHIDLATSRLGGTGTLRAPAVTLDPLRIRSFAAPFTIDGSRLVFDPTTFAIYEGSHRGMLTIALDRDPPRWSTNSHVQRLDLGAFLDALAARDTQLDGTADVETTLSGPVGGDLARTTQGRARVDVTEGVIHDFPLLAAINRALRLTEGSSRDTRFRRLTATLAIGAGGATTTDLVLDARDVQVTAAGRIGFDRSLDFRGIATLSAERTAAAVASIHELARLRRNGTIDLPLTITGTADDPAFEIDLKSAIERGIADELLRQFRRIIRH